MAKGRARSDQLKTAGLGTPPSTHRGSRGSCGGGDFDGPDTGEPSTQTPFRGREKDFGSGTSGENGGMGVGEAAISRMQIPESGICNSSIGEEGEGERVDTHKRASTSWRCGFEWVSALLRSRLRAWDLEDAQGCQCSINDLYNDPFYFKYVEIEPEAVPHIIGRGGRVIRKIEKICGVFLSLRDVVNGGHEMCITGPRPACILAEFAIELLSSEQHSALITLSSLSL